MQTHANAQTHSCLLTYGALNTCPHECAHTHASRHNHTHTYPCSLCSHTCRFCTDSCILPTVVLVWVQMRFRSSLTHAPSSVFISTSACTLQLAWADVCEMLSEIVPGTFLFGIFKKLTSASLKRPQSPAPSLPAWKFVF